MVNKNDIKHVKVETLKYNTNFFKKHRRPPIYDSDDILYEECSKYFEECLNNNIKYSITGLALYLGFASRQSIYDYTKNPEFAYTINRAKLMIENSYENNGGAFDIFVLKNMGWVEQKIEDGDIGEKNANIGIEPISWIKNLKSN